MSQVSVSSIHNADKLLSRSAKATKFLKRRIEFHEATRPDLTQEALKRRYTPLNADKLSSKSKLGSKSKLAQQANNTSATDQDAYLIPELLISLNWSRVRKIGAGLNNLGNTCFLNSVLQCLIYTPPLAEYLLSKQHSLTCRVGNACIPCAMEATVISAQNAQHSSISPKMIVARLKLIAKHMRVGRQEDAHEFLRYLIDNLYSNIPKTYINPKKNISTQADIHNDHNSSVLNKIFGGYLQSQIACLSCKAVSNKIDKFFDLSLCIQNCSSIEKSIEKFIRPETLTGSNSYNCESCKKKSPATKQIQIIKLPQILTIQLVRFSPFSGSKINKHVQYPTKLDVDFAINSQYGEPKSNASYKLLAVLVHAGHSCNSGHYYCYIRSSNNVWHEMNDSHVTQVSESTVLRQSAYILLYEKSSKHSQTKSYESPAKTTDKSYTSNKTAHKPLQQTTDHSQLLNLPQPQPQFDSSKANQLANSHTKDLESILASKKSNKKRKPQSQPPLLSSHKLETESDSSVLSAMPSTPSSLKKFETVDKSQSSTPAPKLKLNGTDEATSLETRASPQTSNGWTVTPKPLKAALSSLKSLVSPSAAITNKHNNDIDDNGNTSNGSDERARKKQNTNASKHDKLRIKVTPKTLTQTKEMKHSLFGTQVQTWDSLVLQEQQAQYQSQREGQGESDQLPTDKILEKREKFIKRKLKKLAAFVHKRPDVYDAEYDKGKVKKVKNKKKNLFKTVANPFQIVSELNTKAK